MSRATRMSPPEPFANNADFNEQMYAALRNSPWWMISLAVHLLIFVIAGLLETTEPPKPKPPEVVAGFKEEPPPEEPEDVDDDPEDVVHQDIETEQPVVKDEPVSEQPVTDNDVDFNESYGETEGLSDAPFDGPSHNGTIGLGGGAGGAFGGRGSNRDGGSKGRGGKERQDAVLDALRWLKAHQSPDGRWEAAGFMKWCDFKPAAADKRPDGAGNGNYDVGVTGLALCAFLGAGFTNRGTHEFKLTVQKGLSYLRSVQDPEGCFGTRSADHFIYNHATASLAMVEAYGMTESPIWKAAAQKCLDFIGLSRNPYFVWRYGVKPNDNDTSVTGWMMMALKSASLINQASENRGREKLLNYDMKAFDGIRDWLKRVTDPETGRTGYREMGTPTARPAALQDAFPGEKSEAMTAVGILARIFMGDDPRSDPMIKKGAELCQKLPPTWNENDGSIDMYYWYYGALGVYQVGGQPWKVWKKAIDKAIVGTQRKDTNHCEYKGSWDPIGPWGEDGGRVYSTAVLAMCLQVYYRYDRVVGIK